MTDMTTSEPTYEVPTKDQLLALAERVERADENLIEADFYDYSEEIAERLLAMREGLALTPELREELEELYEDWEDEGFPIPETDYDAEQEGGPVEAVAMAWGDEDAEPVPASEDPDIDPDPEDAPQG